jgi:thiol-disulfide isomerase/thioredoxin
LGPFYRKKTNQIEVFSPKSSTFLGKKKQGQNQPSLLTFSSLNMNEYDQSDSETLGLLDPSINSPITSPNDRLASRATTSTAIGPNGAEKFPTNNNNNGKQLRRVQRTKYPKNYDKKNDTFSNSRFILFIFFGIMIILTLLLITIYTITTSANTPIPPLYRHVSTFGPKFRVDGAGTIDDEVISKDKFFPSIWLPTVDRTNILETILSQTQTELWIPTAVLHQPLRNERNQHEDGQNHPKSHAKNHQNVPIIEESELNSLLFTDYPSLDYNFISHTTHQNSFPLTLPTSRDPVSVYMSSQYTPVETVYIIQFYASWCGHCRHLSPEAESLAHTFNAQPNSPVRMLRVHCADATQMGMQLCQALNVHAYPALYMTTARTWLWILEQIMPEFHHKAQLWYVRSRGSSPPPGQENIDVSNIGLKPINEDLMKKLLVSIRFNSADGVVKFVNQWLIEQYQNKKNQIILKNNLNGDSQSNDVNNNVNMLQLSTIDTLQEYLRYYSKFAFELNPKTKAEIEKYNAGQSSPLNKILLKSSLPNMSSINLENLPQIEFEKVQKELLHRAGEYEFDMKNLTEFENWVKVTNGPPLDDMISYLIMPRSILSSTELFKAFKPTRHYDPRINFHVRPSLVLGIFNGVSIPLPIRYTVLTQDQLEKEILIDVSKTQIGDKNGQNGQNGGKIPLKQDVVEIYKKGYPSESNLNDKMLYWSIALREALPQCHRAQMLLFENMALNNESLSDSTQSSPEKYEKIQNLLQQMQNNLKSGYIASSSAFGQLPKDLLYTPPSSIGSNPEIPVTSENGKKIEYNLYLSSQTCYESLYDILDMLCMLSSQNVFDNDDIMQKKQDMNNWSLEKKCQHSFCQLKSTLNEYVLPPSDIRSLYNSHSISGVIPPVFSAEKMKNDSNLPKFKHLKDGWELCHLPWSHWDSLDWQQCKGSLSYTRGYTCGLWLNIHSLSVGLDFHLKNKSFDAIITNQNNNNSNSPLSLTPLDSTSPVTLKTSYPLPSRYVLALRAYLYNFFPCRECQEHFLQYSNELPFIVSSQFPIRLLTTLPQGNKSVGSDHEDKHGHEDESDSHVGMTEYTALFPPQEYLVLWLWHTHNMVNQRLAVVEKQHSAADPVFPKVFFPVFNQCTFCRDEKVSICVGDNLKKIDGSKGGVVNVSDTCLWDNKWSYYKVYDYLTQFYKVGK